MERNFFRMEIDTEAYTKKENLTGWEDTIGKMEVFMRASSCMDTGKEKVSSTKKVALFIKVTHLLS